MDDHGGATHRAATDDRFALACRRIVDANRDDVDPAPGVSRGGIPSGHGREAVKPAGEYARLSQFSPDQRCHAAGIELLIIGCGDALSTVGCRARLSVTAPDKKPPISNDSSGPSGRGAVLSIVCDRLVDSPSGLQGDPGPGEAKPLDDGKRLLEPAEQREVARGLLWRHPSGAVGTL